jgi:hypothetical protein
VRLMRQRDGDLRAGQIGRKKNRLPIYPEHGADRET